MGEMLYIGSCRYMKNFHWSFFPARLHTTKEMIFFFENIQNIKNIMKQYPNDILNRIFGDITHPDVIRDTQDFLNKPIQKNTRKIILEVCSRKIYFYRNTIPVKWKKENNMKKNGITMKDLIKKYNLVYHEITDEEIQQDLVYIKKLIKQIFNENIELHIIPNINMKIKQTNEYIMKRKLLVESLEKICYEHDIGYHNVGKFIECNTTYNYLEDVMYNGGSQYCEESKSLVRTFLTKSIC